MIFNFGNFYLIHWMISPQILIQIQWFLTPWICFQVLFPKNINFLNFSPWFIVWFDQISKYHPNYLNSTWNQPLFTTILLNYDYLIKLVSLVLVLTRIGMWSMITSTFSVKHKTRVELNDLRESLYLVNAISLGKTTRYRATLMAWNGAI